MATRSKKKSVPRARIELTFPRPQRDILCGRLFANPNHWMIGAEPYSVGVVGAATWLSKQTIATPKIESIGTTTNAENMTSSDLCHTHNTHTLTPQKEAITTSCGNAAWHRRRGGEAATERPGAFRDETERGRVRQVGGRADVAVGLPDAPNGYRRARSHITRARTSHTSLALMLSDFRTHLQEFAVKHRGLDET